MALTQFESDLELSTLGAAGASVPQPNLAPALPFWAMAAEEEEEEEDEDLDDEDLDEEEEETEEP